MMWFRRRRDPPELELAAELHAARRQLEVLLRLVIQCEQHLEAAKPEASEGKRFIIA
jgi:hypothetical protein